MKTKKRLAAFIIDFFIVVFISSTLSGLSYLNPYISDYNKCQLELNDLMIEYQSIVMKTESKDSFVSAINFVNDKMVPKLVVAEKYNVFNLLWYVLIFLLYNVLFAYFNNGQTLGKKLFKLRVVNKGEDKVTFGRLLLKNSFNGSSLYYGIILVAIVRILTACVMNEGLFLVIFYGIIMTSLLFEISLLVTLFTSKGSRLTSDMIARTEVIEVK